VLVGNGGEARMRVGNFMDAASAPRDMVNLGDHLGGGMSAFDTRAGSRTRAADLSEHLEQRVLRTLKNEALPVRELRARLEPKLSVEQRPLLRLAIYNLINSKRLELTPRRELQLPRS
jgi:hypothetical protein